MGLVGALAMVCSPYFASTTESPPDTWPPRCQATSSANRGWGRAVAARLADRSMPPASLIGGIVQYGWSLGTADWQRFQEAAERLELSQWRRVNLRVLDKDSVPTESGVYAICAKPSDRYPRALSFLY